MSDERRHQREKYLILTAYCLSGAAALIYEVTWTRALALVLGNTVYALSTMLATFMAGLAIGAYVGGKISQRSGNLLMAFALLELGIGVTGLLSIPILYRLPSLYLHIYKYFHDFPTFFFTFEVFMCVNVMIVPTVLMGATFPIVCKRVTGSLAEVGTETGRAYGANTIGAVGGSFAAGFILIPFLGIKGTAIVAASMNTAIAILMLVLSGRKTLIALIAPIPALMLYADWKPSLLNFYTIRNLPANATAESVKQIEKTVLREVFYEEYSEGLVRAFTNVKGGALVLQVDGKIEGTGQGDMPNALLLAYLPVAAHPRASSFLTIGLGSGVTLQAAKEVAREVDLVEINPGVLKAVRLFGSPGLLEGMDIFLNDARNHLFRAEKKYDVISSQPSLPTEFPVASLFTKEFFELASKRLNPGGILCQWLPYYALKESDLHMMLKTFGSVFPFVYVYKVEVSNDIIMLGSMGPLLFSPEQIAERVSRMNRTGHRLRYVLFTGPDHVGRIAAKPDLPVNTDDRPILEFKVVKNMLTAPLKK